ncbi:amidohydrolase family protein [Mycobacterium lentiflavum]|uniref:Amidohydrolase family protein n=1 Tax=Mycobacterium lentiflavum TaxID=141349 RepID=A0ABY3UX72_MYCLN|nr:amidohydrolase family protein [Mycobacterium lentiflavum]ULP41580.1 amidohydrolase family protein [Mycobacterium lentiflavum]
MRKIALEEHFFTPELADYSSSTKAIASTRAWAEASRRLADFTEKRLPDMDAAGLDVQVLSLTAPGLQAEPDAKVATAKATAVNDFLAGIIAEHPTRFSGFCALALQDPGKAADELERGVTQLGLCGALVNAHTQGVYLDDPGLSVVWECAEALDVPLYLHPANGVDKSHVFSGHPELEGPMWSWGVDTATHALRLVFGGVFDRYPNAKLLLGHMGEGLPYVLWRLDSRWDFHNRHGIELQLEYPSHYLRRNLFVTTSGAVSSAPLLCSILALGADHILFATDYPFESISKACEFIANAPLSEADREKICFRNAESLLNVKPVHP